MKEKMKVILLGATGRIGPGLIEEYKEKYSKDYDLIIGIHKKKIDYGLETREINLSDVNKLKEAFKGVDVVVNFAANAKEQSEFSELIEPNIIGAYNVFEAAKEAKCKRVIFASSVHAVKGYPAGYAVKSDDVAKPLNFYGATKAFGEALCSVFSSKHGLSCIAIRVGAYVSNDLIKKVCFERETYDHVITQRDMAQLIHRCIIAPENVKFGILSGISNNKSKSMDLEYTKKLVGYSPEDDVFKICEEIKAEDK